MEGKGVSDEILEEVGDQHKATLRATLRSVPAAAEISSAETEVAGACCLHYFDRCVPENVGAKSRHELAASTPQYRGNGPLPFETTLECRLR